MEWGGGQDKSVLTPGKEASHLTELQKNVHGLVDQVLGSCLQWSALTAILVMLRSVDDREELSLSRMLTGSS